MNEAAGALRRRGYKVWRDVVELPPGAPLPAEIADLIVNQVDHFLAFLPARGELTGWLEYEYRLAQSRALKMRDRTFIIPVLLGRKSRPLPPDFEGVGYFRLRSTISRDLRAFGEAIRSAVDRENPNKRSVRPQRKSGGTNARPLGAKLPGKLDPVEEIVASITGGTNSLAVWARKLAQFLKAWCVLIVRRQKQGGWECIDSTGIEKRLVKDFSRLPKQCQPPSVILAGKIFQERKEAVVPQNRTLVVNYDSRLWAPVCFRSTSKRARVLGAIGALGSSLRGSGEFLTVDVSVVKAMAAKLAERAEFIS